jgi:deoxyhypusine synthase
MVYTDVTIAFPILCLYALSNEKPIKPKRLYKKLPSYYEGLSTAYFDKKRKS